MPRTRSKTATTVNAKVTVGLVAGAVVVAAIAAGGLSMMSPEARKNLFSPSQGYATFSPRPDSVIPANGTGSNTGTFTERSTNIIPANSTAEDEKRSWNPFKKKR